MDPGREEGGARGEKISMHLWWKGLSRLGYVYIKYHKVHHQYHVVISCVSYLPPIDLPVVQNANASAINSTAILVQWQVRAMHTA